VPEECGPAVRGFFILSMSRGMTDFGAPLAFPVSEIRATWGLLGGLGEEEDYVTWVQAMDAEWRKLSADKRTAEAKTKGNAK